MAFLTVPTPLKSKRRCCQILLACLWLGSSMVLAGVSKPVSDYQVKAVYLYNFTKFVYWPTNADAPSDTPFVIGIVGDDPFKEILKDALGNELVQGRPIVIRQFTSNEPITKCQILFIAQSEKDRLKAVLDQIRGQSILTVADIPEAAEQGVMINLSLVDGSVKMEINQGAVDAAGLQISAKVLRLARIVNAKLKQAPSTP